MNIDLLAMNCLAALAAPGVVLMYALCLGKEDARKIQLILFGQTGAFIFALFGLILQFINPTSTEICLVRNLLELRIDLISASLQTGSTLIAAIVLAYSERYLALDRSRMKFMLLTTALSTAASVVCLSGNILLSMLCWCLISVTLFSLMRLQPSSRAAATIVLKHHVAADAALMTAVGLLVYWSGTVNFSEINSGAHLSQLSTTIAFGDLHTPVTRAGLLTAILVTAMSIKSALFPFHRWLLATLEAPTPLSGLLHAGVVNIAAIMACRMMPVLQLAVPILVVWGIVAAVSAMAGTLSMSAHPDVKRKLVYSTVGQMGFMCLQCAAGAIHLAVIHVLAHGLFKCHMFLQSGSAIAEGSVKRRWGYGAGENTASPDSRYVFVVLSTALFCAAIAALYGLSGATSISALVAAACIICTTPAFNRTEAMSLTVAWSLILVAAVCSVTGSEIFLTRLVLPESSTLWILPSGIMLFASGSLILQKMRNTQFVQSLYVAALSGFYIEEVLAVTEQLKKRDTTITADGIS